MSDTPSPSPLLRPPPLRNLSAQKALGILLEGYECAQDLQVSRWEFGTERQTLLGCGCTPHLLLWFVRKGYAEEGPPARPSKRATRYQGSNGRKLSPAACFVLTELGAAVARESYPYLAPATSRNPLEQAPGGRGLESPVWDRGSGNLSFLGRLVKRFRNAASNQRSLLDAFQRYGWPERLADPLGQRGNRKQRLHDAIKNLNRGHRVRCLRFYGADSGRAVGWKRLD